MKSCEKILALAAVALLAPPAPAQCVGGNCPPSFGSRFQSFQSFQSDGFGSRFQSSHSFEFAPRPRIQLVERPSFVNLRVQQRGLFGRRTSVDLDTPGVSLRFRQRRCFGGWCP